MKNTFLALCLIGLVSFSFMGCSNTKQKTANEPGFIKVNGTQLEQDGHPYYFIGTNFWYGAYLGADAAYGDRERLINELDQLHALGVNNLRIAAASEESDFSKPLSPPFQYKNGTYNDTLFDGLDFLLFEMGKRGMKAVLFLNNYWDWTGGMPQYVSWAEDVEVIDPTANPKLGWDDYTVFSARFYTNEQAQKRYRNYIKAIVNRENTYSKIIYKDDPTIMAWQLANEPRPNPKGNIEKNIAQFSSWVDQTAGYIKSLDTNHLVSTGNEGSKGSLNSIENAFKINQSEHIDYMTFHLWPKNWGWFNPEQSDSLQKTLVNAKDYIQEHILLAIKLNKPAVVEEFGLNRDSSYYTANTPVTSRNAFYEFVFEFVSDSKENGSALAGCNFWGWGGEGRAQHADAVWRLQDTVYLGDPYPEHQGLNSVYNTDDSTLDLIKRYSETLKVDE
jgi:mannan endo-1,4-beta-mannosidase